MPTLTPIEFAALVKVNANALAYHAQRVADCNMEGPIETWGPELEAHARRAGARLLELADEFAEGLTKAREAIQGINTSYPLPLPPERRG